MNCAALLTACVAAFVAASASAQIPSDDHKLRSAAHGANERATTTPSPAPAPLVGGSDDCTSPDLVVGTGSFSFDNTTATTGAEGQHETLCLAFATTAIQRDVWFQWVAPFTGIARLSTCGSAALDTRLAAYAGTTCPAAGSALACNDDSCATTQSQIDFTVTQGSSYVLQIGNYPFGGPGTGAFTLTEYVPVPLDDCSLPQVLAGPGTFAFDLSGATTSAQQPGTCPDAANDAWYAYTATRNGTATITTCGLITSPYADTVIAVYDGAGCPTFAALACNNDACGVQARVTWPIVCGQTYTIQIGQYDVSASAVSGSFDLTESGTACGPAGAPFCFGDGSGAACPCANYGAAGNGCANSVDPNGANLSASGSALLANDTLVLHGSGMPSSSCLYFQGTTQVSAPFGDGVRCVGGTLLRLAARTNVAGASQHPEPGDAPVSVQALIMAPATRTYQVWYRNAGPYCTSSTFNLTNGLSIVFTP